MSSSVFVNSLGQSGTHLAAKCLEWLGFEPVGMATTDPTFDLPGSVDKGRADRLPIFDSTRHFVRGVDWLYALQEAEGYRKRWSKRIFPNSYGAGHLLPTEAAVSLFGELGLRMILILRAPPAWLIATSRTASLEETAKRLRRAAFGCDDPPKLSMVERYERIAEWTKHPFVYVVRFEDLVGPEGGGDALTQRKAVAAIARHCGTHPTRGDVDEVCENMFGGTQSFRRGSASISAQYTSLLDAEVQDALAAATAIYERVCRLKP